MAEQVVRDKNPELHAMLSKQASKFQWEVLKEDIEALYYLVPENFQESELVLSVIAICNKWALSELTLVPRFSILKTVKVRSVLNSYIAKISDKEKLKKISTICCEKSQTLSFYEKAKDLLSNCSQDTFDSLGKRIFDVFTDIRNTFIGIFLSLEKHLRQEYKENLSDMLNRAFYEQVVLPHKNQFFRSQETRKIASELEKTQKSKSSHDDFFASASEFQKKGINNYCGQLNPDNQRHGYGKITYFNGDSYEGEWFEDKRKGEGLYIFKFGGAYKGSFDMDLPNGLGCKTYKSGNVYNGNFVNGKKSGSGEMRFRNGDMYQGNWENDDMHGYGKYMWDSGDMFEGNFHRDLREGKGVLFLKTGDIIEGIWRNGVLIEN